MVFTNAELAKIAELEEKTPENLKSIKGIGKKRVEKYGQQLLELFHKEEQKEEKEEQ